MDYIFEKDNLQKIVSEIVDRYLGSSSSANILINAPLYASFCDANKDSISEQTIVLMAMKYIANEYEVVIPAQLDDWVNRFEKVVLKHLMSKDCAD